MRLRLSLLVLAALGLAAAAPAPPPATADLRGELAASEQTRTESRAEAQDLQREIQALQADLNGLMALERNDERITGDKRARLDALNAREAALGAEIGRNQVELARLLGALELYRREPPPALLVNPRSARDAVRAAILIQAVTPELERRAAAFRAKAETLRVLRRATAAASEDLFTSESARADKRAEIDRLIAEKSALQHRLAGDADAADRNAQALAVRLRALGIDARAPQAPAGNAPTTISAPVHGVMIRRFGQKAPAGAGGGLGSDGLTWRALPGAVVTAPAGGVVEYAGAMRGWGGVVILRIGGGYHLVLAGLDAISAVQGRPVSTGQALGRMADRRGSEPELYLEARRNGDPVDPAPWLRQAR
jgi:septal ring factor EnvC (AmiA/AmiB activator)